MTVVLVVLLVAMCAMSLSLAHDVATLRESLRAAAKRESDLVAEIQRLRAMSAYDSLEHR